MTKDVTEKVTETTDTITEKAKGSVSGVLGTAKNATDIIKNKILGGDQLKSTHLYIILFMYVSIK